MEADVTDRRTFERTCDVCGRRDHRTALWTTISFEPIVITIPQETDQHLCIRCRYELNDFMDKLRREKQRGRQSDQADEQDA